MGFGAHRQFSLVDRRLKRRTLTTFSATCTAVSLGLLLAGLAYYLSYRNQLPAPLARLGISPHVLPLGSGPDVSLGSLPSFVHVAAFSLLTCALFRPSLLLALAAGAAWGDFERSLGALLRQPSGVASPRLFAGRPHT